MIKKGDKELTLFDLMQEQKVFTPLEKKLMLRQTNREFLLKLKKEEDEAKKKKAKTEQAE